MERKKRPPLFDRLKKALENGIAFERGEKALRVSKLSLPPPPREFGPDDVRTLRERLHLSQGGFARLLHVAPKTVQSWEQGLRTPSHAALRLLQFIEEPGTLEKTLVGLSETSTA